FFVHDSATTELYTLSLHDALPIFKPLSTSTCCVFDQAGPSASTGSNSRSRLGLFCRLCFCLCRDYVVAVVGRDGQYQCFYRYSRDRKSTRLNSSHVKISYAVFCLK